MFHHGTDHKINIFRNAIWKPRSHFQLFQGTSVVSCCQCEWNFEFYNSKGFVFVYNYNNTCDTFLINLKQ